MDFSAAHRESMLSRVDSKTGVCKLPWVLAAGADNNVVPKMSVKERKQVATTAREAANATVVGRNVEEGACPGPHP